MRIVLSVLFVLVSCLSIAQALNVDPTKETYIAFNPMFIQQNQIDTVIIENHIKRRNETLRKTEGEEELIFDSLGRLITSTKVIVLNRNLDTSSVYFQYFVSENRQSELNSSGNVRYQIVKRYDGEILVGLEKLRFDGEMKVENIQSDKSINSTFLETYKYKWINDSTKIKTVFNSNGKPFLNVTYVYNSSISYLLSETNRYMFGSVNSCTEFKYNQSGLLSYITNEEEGLISFSYNEMNDVQSVSCEKNGEKLYKREFVYNDKGLLSAELLKYEDSPTVYIKKFIFK